VTNILYDDLVLDEILGVGNFGVVYKTTLNNRDFAVKTIRTKAKDELSTLVMIKRESDVYTAVHLKHDNILTLYGVCSWPKYALVLEYASLGSLRAFLHDAAFKQQRSTLTFTTRARMLQNAAAAMKHLHGHGIVHGDIKTENIVVMDNLTVKLCDFGLSHSVHDEHQFDCGTIGTSIMPHCILQCRDYCCVCNVVAVRAR
jgi:serine/threonine protein kinase